MSGACDQRIDQTRFADSATFAVQDCEEEQFAQVEQGFVVGLILDDGIL